MTCREAVGVDAVVSWHGAGPCLTFLKRIGHGRNLQSSATFYARICMAASCA